MRKPHETTLYYRPGESLAEGDMAALVGELRSVARTCFDRIPEYQCLEGTENALADKIIAVARRPDGRMDGFCSAMIVPVPEVGEVLHLGLTCVRPDTRGARLTHALTSRLIVEVMLRHRPLQPQWVSNVACVLSSLGSVARHFDAVYPSPFEPAHPRREHLLVAQTLDRYYRERLYIHGDASFDEDAFVFRSSVKGTMFQKEARDPRFRHRHGIVNDFYEQRMRFDEGDEVLQVGCVTAWSLVKYAFGRRRTPAARPTWSRAARRWADA